MYEVHRDQTYHPDDASISRVFHAGRAVRVASPAAERVKDGFLVRETTELWPSTVDIGAKETRSEWTLFSFGRELSIHATGESRDGGKMVEIVHEHPLRILPDATAGAKWSAGTFRTGGLRAQLRGEVVGVSDLSGTPAWPGALQVRLEGTLSGTVDSAQGPAEIESGKIERVLWFARGVGLVREVTTTTAELKLPEDHRAQLLQVVSFRLLEHSGTQ